jgi:putative inorganic carbon (HCO3(-)) transporter
MYMLSLSSLIGVEGFGMIKKKDLVYLAVLLTPLSIKIEVFDGAYLSLPTELLAIIFSISVIPVLYSQQQVFKKLISHPLSILLIIDTSWLLVCSLNSSMPLVSFKRLFMRMIFIQCFYVGTVVILKQKEKLFKLFFLYGLGFVVIFFPALFRHAEYAFSPNTANYACRPFFVEHTVYGACIAFIIPSFLIMAGLKPERRVTKHHFIIVALTLILIVAGILSYSRAALLSLGVGGLVFTVIRCGIKPLSILGIAILIVLSLYIGREKIYHFFKTNTLVSSSANVLSHYGSIANITTDASNKERINRWICALKMAESKPLFGFGPGTYQFEYGQFQAPAYKTNISTNKGDKGNAHSEYLTYLSEAGIIGLVNFALIVSYSIYLGVKIYRRENDEIIKKTALAVTLGLITFYFHGFFNSFIDQDKMAVLVFSGLGILTALDLNFKNYSLKDQISER